eukprot:CAMPEP_0114626288 /NCGR_PEP_ID=MMETSP0168-20121206/11704_1 /TAXON_ID=95228 ORGANISM="Vannella sp., Strain DIVA3 517/6/12" /NCGR_SAMPLE_ID=MMETSP0168 /ASSEMBLY_ACC=CAM_ASM_000044 /LENGTH=75 /DNA_ID=CAMNT_0001837587 /DNA_START=93 /DNA_END=316 /DNA_ORIENTATION=+
MGALAARLSQNTGAVGAFGDETLQQADTVIALYAASTTAYSMRKSARYASAAICSRLHRTRSLSLSLSAVVQEIG